MFDKKTLKLAKFSLFSIAAGIFILWFIAYFLGKSEKDGWMGMAGMFAFSLFGVIPFILMFIAVSLEGSFIRIENQISKKLGTNFTFIKQSKEKCIIKRAIWMILGLLGSFSMLIVPVFLFGYGISFSVSQSNLFWMILGVFACLIVSIIYITAFMVIFVRIRFKRIERVISEIKD